MIFLLVLVAGIVAGMAASWLFWFMVVYDYDSPYNWRVFFGPYIYFRWLDYHGDD